MTHLLLVAAGGAVGAAGRHLVSGSALKLLGPGFPHGTLIVNVVGSFLMGLLVAWLALRATHAGTNLRLFLATGVLGGFTTFSAFSLDVVLLWERGQIEKALLYAVISVAISVTALVAGLALGRNLF
ncbi:fluoride efflux transporter CrcB [Afifella pfennigii]|uniref:fluoride efflux transporter CrcB n=1 Tax=Afifella pfennigii TaxID=209897 RepID=UPI00047D8A29|nr:fluoride efflux transporter CrcB [Afifella pfennigii]